MLHTTGNDSHIYSSELFLKQGISSQYVMLDFISMG